jgi:hypothetical protein
MDRIGGLFKEVKGEIVKAILIYSFLDALMVFFIFYFVISLFKIDFIYTLAVPGALSLTIFMTYFFKRLHKSRLKDMEDANPQLREILRTAHDNQGEDNLMVHALFEELKGKLRTASSGKLLDSKKITIRVISAIILVFLIVFLSSMTINIKKIDIPFDKLRFLSQGATRAGGNMTDLVFNQTDVIYGDSSIAKLGSDVINIKVNPTASAADLSHVSEVEKINQVSGATQQEVEVTSSAYDNQKVLDDAEAAVNYSQRISKIS